MAIYTKSTGEEIDTSTMPDAYLDRAMNKAQQEGNQENIDALQSEIDARAEQQ